MFRRKPRGNPFVGPIAFEGRETTDHRALAPDALDFKPRFTEPIAVMLLNSATDGHDGVSTVAGIIHEVTRVGDTITARGTVMLPPGEYGCGVDLSEFKATKFHDMLVITSARLVGLHVYPVGGTAKPTWPDAKIVVTKKAK